MTEDSEVIHQRINNIKESLESIKRQLEVNDVQSNARKEQIELKLDNLIEKVHMRYDDIMNDLTKYNKELTKLKFDFNSYKSTVVKTVLTILGIFATLIASLFGLFKSN